MSAQVRLAEATLAQVPAAVERFDYDRADQAIGIVHFGIGAFHRAHQAWYTDRAMDSADRDWLIAGVSLRSADVAEQMNPQDGLYTVNERGADGAKSRVVGAVREVLVAPADPERVIALLAAPSVRIVSFTVTEKGYCRAADGALDFAQAGEGSIYRFLAEGLRRRRDAGLPGLTLMSCDNLAENGRQLARLLGEYLDRADPSLRAWFEAECTCPSTMVDRIVPATTEADRAAVAAALGVDDAAAVMTEPFSQWVIEDRFAAGRPAWDAVGAELVADVAPYETAKLRMLNGAHSALAYLGLPRGHTFVHQAVADPEVAAVVRRLMLDEAAPSIAPAPGQDMPAYAEALLARFANPALNHKLAQIAMDGSQKIPQRWLETLAHHQGHGRSCPAILQALGGWLDHLRGDPALVSDPMADRLRTLWAEAGADGIAAALFGRDGLFSGYWTATSEDLRGISGHLRDT